MSKELLADVNWNPDETVQRNARKKLTMMGAEYFNAGRKLVAAKPHPADLHAFRLATKRFRYTLELFRGVYGPVLDKKIRELKPVQEALGAVNDCIATKTAFDFDNKFRDYLDRRAMKKTREFYRVWKEQFDAPGNRAAWINYLARVRNGTLRKTKSPVHSDDLAGQEVGARK